MFTEKIRRKLVTDYGIRDIPHELLVYFVQKNKAKVEHVLAPEATCAWLIANEWQRGKTQISI